MCVYSFQKVDLLIGFFLRSGEFADVLGEDYLGLRALGIAAEFGLSNLSIPKKLLKGKKGQNKPTAWVFFFSFLAILDLHSYRLPLIVQYLRNLLYLILHLHRLCRSEQAISTIRLGCSSHITTIGLLYWSHLQLRLWQYLLHLYLAQCSDPHLFLSILHYHQHQRYRLVINQPAIATCRILLQRQFKLHLPLI